MSNPSSPSIYIPRRRAVEWISRIVLLASRFLIVWQNWCLGAAMHFVYLSKFGHGEREATLGGGLGKFRYRAQADRSVLNQFSRDCGIIDAADGPPIKVIVDAGANIGVFSAMCLRVYPQAKIVALEAESRNAAILKKNLAQWPNTVALQSALWKERGSVSVCLADNADGHSVAALHGDSASQSVPSLSVRDLLDDYQLEKIDILKMDIEGAEGVVVEAIDDATLSRINAIRFECNDADAHGTALTVLHRLNLSEFDAFAFDENLYLIRRSTGWRFRRYYSGIGYYSARRKA